MGAKADALRKVRTYDWYAARGASHRYARRMAAEAVDDGTEDASGAKGDDDDDDEPERDIPPLPELASEAYAGCRFYIAPQGPWKGPRSSVAAEVTRAT